LDVSQTAVSDAGIESVARLPSLDLLDVSDTKVTSGGLHSLRGREIWLYMKGVALSTEQRRELGRPNFVEGDRKLTRMGYYAIHHEDDGSGSTP